MDNIFKELGKYAKYQNILLVEDDEVLNKELEKLLKNFFESVDVAYDGEAGLELYLSKKYDLIITDIRMPKLDGIELCRAIRYRNPKQAIITMSVYEKMEQLIELINIGVDGFILKPYKINTFLSTVLRICENEASKKEFEKEKITKLIKLVTSGNRQDHHVINNKITSIVESYTNTKLDNTVETYKKETVIEEHIEEDIVEEQKIEEKKKNKNVISTISKNDSLYLALKQAISTFSELNDDFEEAINNTFLGSITEDKLITLSEVLRKYYFTFFDFEVFEEVANTLNDLATKILELNANNISTEQKQAIEALEYIHTDIKEFINVVFIDKESVDVCYFTNSLKVCVDDIISNLTKQKQTTGDMFFF